VQHSKTGPFFVRACYSFAFWSAALLRRFSSESRSGDDAILDVGTRIDFERAISWVISRFSESFGLRVAFVTTNPKMGLLFSHR
jgi:hypothetical protein